MRISGVQNNNAIAHRALLVREQNLSQNYLKNISRCREKLADTKFVDVVLDSHGFAIKDKMTDILQRIQSFSFLPLENAVAVNITGEESPAYKFFYSTFEEAKKTWRNINDKYNGPSIDAYVNTALWLEEELSTRK